MPGWSSQEKAPSGLNLTTIFDGREEFEGGGTLHDRTLGRAAGPKDRVRLGSDAEEGLPSRYVYYKGRRMK